MSADAVLETTIDDVVELSPELTEGDGLVDGQIRLYDVESDESLESNAERFFDRTLLTDGLEDSLKRLRDTLNGEDRTRIQELYGPYGTGKTHQMVALYHCFASPDAVADWADGRVEGLGAALPDDAEPIVLSLQKEQFDYLWEPLFDALGYEPDRTNYDEEGGYPTIDVISEAVGDRTVAFFVDELEDFFDSLTGRREAANRGFLQALCEASTRPDTRLFPVVSVLREESTVQDILSRQERVEVNMSNQVSIGEVLRHRLIGEVRDEDRLRSLADEYVEAYAETDHVDLQPGFRDRLIETYPFHPELISALQTRYAAGADSGTRETADGEEIQSGPTRGMLYLFARVLVDRYEETDLLTHGQVDAVDYNDELGRINIQHDRPDRCFEDIERRLADAEVDFGREILSTVLIYSLTPGLDEGATREDVVVGTFHAGDRINDIVVGLQRLQGEVYHLWTDDDERYVVREDENPRSLVRNAARDVSDERALQLLAQTVESVFGTGAYPVGFTDDGRLGEVPDDKRAKTVVKNAPWTEAEVAEIVKNRPTGRQWRNTLVFVQPSGDTDITAGARTETFLGKAKEILGARLRKDDQNFAEDIREEIDDLEDEYEADLERRVRSAYGDVLDTDDPLNGFDTATTLDLETYTGLERLPTASEIAAASEAAPFDLKRHAEDIVADRLDARDEITVADVYDRFLRDPSRPIPADESAVASAVAEALDGDDVLAHRTDGFTETFDTLDPDTTLVAREDVADWTDDDVASELRTAFGRGEEAVDLGSFELDLRDRTDVWFPEQSVEEAVKHAAGRLAREDRYVLFNGDEILDRPRSDATLRDTADADSVDADDVRDRITATLSESPAVDTADVLGSIRNDRAVHLPADETERVFRRAVDDLLDGPHRLREDGRYPDQLGDRDPVGVTIVPFLGDDGRTKVLEYADGLDPETTFRAEGVRDETVPDEPAAAVANVLFWALDGDRETDYRVAPGSRDDPADWHRGIQFQVRPEGDEFQYEGTDAEELRQQWKDEGATGEVAIGTVEYTVPDDSAVPSSMTGVASFGRSRTILELSEGVSHEEIAEIVTRIPTNVIEIEIDVEFD
ncbi:DUF499 domain-containing protein [Halobaculum sp. MBLA0143]|uniref:DUF499 domain-containing protein n=1 Tax=Halobaculum sp. MBLA0143 TaxID=3079933 RepID=UPI003523E278